MNVSLLDVLFPPVCLNCRKNQREKFGLCVRCLSQVEFTGIAACIRCGRICRGKSCAPLDHQYSCVLSLAHYIGPWRKVVQGAKFARDRGVTMELARELVYLAQAAGFSYPQAIVPAPAAGNHWRPFDAVALVAAELASSTGAPVVQALARRPGRDPQVLLTRRQRLHGLEDYIYAKQKKMAGVIWLVDDVYTTGATADACAGALLAAGARRVMVLTLAA